MLPDNLQLMSVMFVGGVQAAFAIDGDSIDNDFEGHTISFKTASNPINEVVINLDQVLFKELRVASNEERAKVAGLDVTSGGNKSARLS